jgi:hypothetical protein
MKSLRSGTKSDILTSKACDCRAFGALSCNVFHVKASERGKRASGIIARPERLYRKKTIAPLAEAAMLARLGKLIEKPPAASWEQVRVSP